MGVVTSGVSLDETVPDPVYRVGRDDGRCYDKLNILHALRDDPVKTHWFQLIRSGCMSCKKYTEYSGSESAF